MAGKVGLRNEIIFTGGVARNEGVVQALKQENGIDEIKVPPEPQLTGALGAAIIAMEDYKSDHFLGQENY